MENPPFEDVFPIQDRGFSIAMFVLGPPRPTMTNFGENAPKVFASTKIDRGYHIDGFRCDAISSMYPGGVFFSETGQSLGAPKKRRSFFLDSSFIS